MKLNGRQNASWKSLYLIVNAPYMSCILDGSYTPTIGTGNVLLVPDIL